MLKFDSLVLFCIVAVILATPCSAVEEIDLAGKWEVCVGAGEDDRTTLPGVDDFRTSIHLPGSLAENSLGDDPALDSPWTGTIKWKEWNRERYDPYKDPGNFKMPFWLQPAKIYKGPAWYRREVRIPKDWGGKRIELLLERPHWKTTVWIDGERLGSCDSLSTAHTYDLTSALAPGRHSLTVAVDNRMIVNVGPNSHSVSDHTQSNWNGLVGELKLVARAPVWIEDLQVYPDAKEKTARVRLQLGNITGQKMEGLLAMKVEDDKGDSVCTGEIPYICEGRKTEIEAELELGADAKLWDEFRPNIYRVHAAIPGDTSTASFGLRDVSVLDKRLQINGQKLFLRGTLECCIFPDTGYPPCDVEAWRKIIRTCKEFGLNHIRFHSWCPPAAAFQAADELGFYYQVECASWANSGAAIGRGKPLDKWLYEEGERISRAYGNHPSFIMMAYGNEPSGPRRGAKYLSKWCEYWKQREPRCLHTGAAGWPAIEKFEFYNVPGPRIQGWGQGLESRINAQHPQTESDYSAHVRNNARPIVTHEIGQWCAYPNLAEASKYEGVLRPMYLDIFSDFLDENHMRDQAHDFLMASGMLQTLCYKEEIESQLRTRGLGGFQLLDLHDFPGQGTALVGVLDAYWDPKPYISAERYRRFCNAIVPLARMKKRCWSTGEKFTADIEYSNFGPAAITSATTAWRVVGEEGQTLMRGELPKAELPIDNGIGVGRIEFDCSRLPAAQRYTLVVGLAGTDIENDWGFWVFPAELPSLAADPVDVAQALGPRQLARLAEGGRVLLMAPPSKVKSDVAIGFSPVFWNTAWTGGQAPHTLGILCDPENPVFKRFPTDYHSDWQWWELIHGSAAMILNDLPKELRPLVQPIDTWFRANKLGLLFEARVNGGKLMVCSMDLDSDLDQRLVARQLRYSIIEYMASDAFDPKVELSPEQISGLFGVPGSLE